MALVSVFASNLAVQDCDSYANNAVTIEFADDNTIDTAGIFGFYHSLYIGSGEHALLPVIIK